MARERAQRAKRWAKEDDEKASGLWTASPPPAPSPAACTSSASPSHAVFPKAPSTCLIGLSLLGNLDGIYKHASFPEIQLHTLTTGSRQRSGGMLMFGYTFAGMLWVSLGYDENGFEKDTVGRFWGQFLQCMNELLLVD